MLTYNLIKELSNGGSAFIFNEFQLRPFTKIVYTDDKIPETINFRKTIYIDTNLLHYFSFTRILWSLPEIVLIFLCFSPWLDFLINCSTKSLILCHKNLFEVFCIDYSFPEGEVIALAFESCPNPLLTLLIILCCCYEQETTNLVLL